MVRLLLDEGLPWRAARWLQERGIDAVHVHDVSLTSAPDHQILAAARDDRRVCVTLDHDFHGILAETGATEPSVVLLRVHQSGFLETAELIARVLSQFQQQLETPVAVTVTRRGVRLRKLPLK